MIKKLAAISLICLLIFNWYGYRLLINYFEHQATSYLQARLDNNHYDESRLIEIRVPLNMPYITDWAEFETYEGETEINGIHYKYVKRKVDKGELVLLCIPNEQKTSLQAAKHDLFKLVNDIQQSNGKSSKDHAAKLSMSDYINYNSVFSNKIEDRADKMYSLYSCFFPTTFIATPTQPPDC